MDKARAAASDLAAKADSARASGSGGDTDRYFRDLGVLAYLEACGRPAPSEERERVMDALKGMEARGAIGTLTLQTAAPPPPGGTVPPPPGGAAPPPPGAAVPPPAPQAHTPAPAQSAPTTPAPPPPSWMTKDDDDKDT
jgi:hypothetical protein